MEKIKVGIIGAGTMGSGIAQVAATAGHQTFLYDVDPTTLQKAKTTLEQTLNKLSGKGKISTETAKQILSNIQFVSAPSQFESCGLIIEAILENLDIKRKLFNDIEKIVDEDCILATNTSSLSITSIASVCNKPGRVVGIHFFNPAPLMPLVEIIPGLETDEKMLNDAFSLINSWGKQAVKAKDSPGFIVNRIARPFYGEAIRIYEEGIADHVTIDRAMKEIGGFKMGPFELMDLIGNDVNYAVTETVWKQMFFDARYKPSLTQKRLFEAGRFGRKTGQGYYNYQAPPPPEGGSPSQTTLAKGSAIESPSLGGVGEAVFFRILSMLINEAADALYFGVASKEDIELAMTKGVNYPKGLLKWCDEIGASKVYKTLVDLREEYSEERYRPSVLLKKMATEGKAFF